MTRIFRIAALFFLCISTLFSQTLQDLEHELKEIQKELAKHEEQLNRKSDDTILTVGGRIRLDMVYNSPSVGGSGGDSDSAYDFYLTPRSISGLKENREVAMQAKDSRLWFKTRRDTPYGNLQSLVEVDFLGSAGTENVTNSHNIRLRHAYVSLDALTIGQTYSTFMGSGTSDAIQGGVDILLVRQPLIRYTAQLGSFTLETAIESAETTYYSQESNSTLAANDDQFPDLTARIKYQSSIGEFSLSLLARQLRVDHSDLNITASSKESFAYHLAGRINGLGSDKISFAWAQGTGMGRYLSYNYFSSAALHSDHTLTLLPIKAYHIAYQHWWNPKVRSSVLFSGIEIDNDTSVFGSDATKNAHSYHANIRFSPFSQALLTLEYIYAQKQDKAGRLQHLNRLYLSSSYDF